MDPEEHCDGLCRGRNKQPATHRYKYPCQAGVLLLAIVGIVFCLLNVHRRHTRERRQRVIEANVQAAERQRLQTLMQYLSMQADRKTSAATSQQPIGMWAYQPTPAVNICPHGNNQIPPAYSAGYRGACLDICPLCNPQQVLSSQGQLIPNMGQFGQQSGWGQVAQAQNFPVGTRLRRAQRPEEMPPGPPPAAPPGFVAVPMVLESV